MKKIYSFSLLKSVPFKYIKKSNVIFVRWAPVLLFFMLGQQVAFGQGWDNNGNNYSTGKLGIGVNQPNTQLEVVGTGTVLFRNRMDYSINGYVDGALNIFKYNWDNANVNTVLNLGNYFNSNSSISSILAIDFRSGDGSGIFGGPSSPAGRIKVQTSWTAPRMDFDLGGSTILSLLRSGQVCIGTTNPGSYQLAVEGKISARHEIRIFDFGIPFPDYVFQNTYKLKSLSEVETYIKANNHLPEIPSAQEVECNGMNLVEMNVLMLKKVEELTLHLIEQNKQVIEQNKQIEVLKQENEALKIRVDNLEEE